MDTTGWIMVAVALAVLVAVVAWIVLTSRRSAAIRREEESHRLRRRFGPEYDRAVADAPDRAVAEQELTARERRHSGFTLRELTAAERAHYTDDWARLQAAFVDRPGLVLAEADRLVADLMSARGYPQTDPEVAAADLSVEHADVVSAFRRGHEVAVSGTGDMEALRSGMLSFRSVIATLLTPREVVGGPPSGEPTDGRAQPVDLRAPVETGRHARTGDRPGSGTY